VLFKNASTGKLHTIPLEEVDAIYWQKLGTKPGMKLALRDGIHWRFGGFKENVSFTLPTPLPSPRTPQLS